MKANVLFTTERGVRHQQDALRAAPPQVTVTIARQPTPAELRFLLADADYLISERVGNIDAQTIAAAPRLKLIQRLGSLTYDIDLKAATKEGISVCYLPVTTVIQVAEHIILQMLAVGKKLREVESVALAASLEWGESKRTNEDTFAYNWSKRSGVSQLWEKKIGIIGFGEIGAEVARRLSGWGCSVLYNKRRRLPAQTESLLGLTFIDAPTLYAQSDYLINLLPYFTATDMLLDATVFDQMKAGAFFVSCGSGSVIDEAALANSVASGKLGGVALDTFEWEPVRAGNPLIRLAKNGYNVLLTPHTAAGTEDGRDMSQLRARDYQNIINHLQGRPLRYQVA